MADNPWEENWSTPDAAQGSAVGSPPADTQPWQEDWTPAGSKPVQPSREDQMRATATQNERTNPGAAIEGYGANVARQIPYMHELASAIDATTHLSPGKDFGERYNNAEQNQQAMAEGEIQAEPRIKLLDNKYVPDITPVGVGDAAAVIGSGALLPMPELKGAGYVARGAKAAGTGAGYGALYGSDSADAFASNGDAAMQRAGGAGVGAAIGAGLGPAMEFAPDAAKGVGRLGKYVYNKVTDTPAADKSVEAGRDMFVKALEAEGKTPEDVASRQEQLQQLTGEPVAALHAATENVGGLQTQGGTLLGVASKAARAPGEAPKIASQLVLDGMQAPKRVGRAFDDLLGENDYYGMLNAAHEQRASASPLYTQAYAANKNMASPEIDRILETPAGKKALGDVQEEMANEGRLMGQRDPELTAEAREADVDVPKEGVASGLSMETLDRVKRGIDDQARAVAKQVSRGDATGADLRRVNNISKSLRDEMDRLDTTAKPATKTRPAVPGVYAQARATSAPGIHMSNALDEGADFMSQDPQEVEAYMKDPNKEPDTKAAYMVGARSAAQKNVKDPLKAADAMHNQDMLDRVQHMASSPESFQTFTQRMQHEQNVARNNAFLRTASNAGQQNTGKGMAGSSQSGPVRRVANAVANPTGAAVDEGINFLSNQWQKNVDKMDSKTAAEFMRYATSKDPNFIRSAAQKGSGAKSAAPSPLKGTATTTTQSTIPHIIVNPRPGYYDQNQARGGAIHMAKGGAVYKRPKSYSMLEKRT